MYILGINAYHADASAAIFKDGQIIAATEEERFSRIKHQAGFPEKAIQFCLREAGITIEQVDYFAVGSDPLAKMPKKIAFYVQNLSFSKNISERLTQKSRANSLVADLERMTNIPERYFKKRMIEVEHHRSHLASAFFPSPFEEAACISLDGSGDFTTTMLAVGKGNKLEVLKSIDFPHSIGVFYTAFTQLLGFPHYGDEYKVMGMAPYGEPRYLSNLHEVVNLQDDGLFSLNMKFFRKPTDGYAFYDDQQRPVIPPLYSDEMIRSFGAVREKDEPLTEYHKDLAASVQAMTEKIIFHLLNHLQKITGLKKLCIAGGVGQNSVANGKILLNTGFEELYLPPAAHDAGLSMGAALFVAHNNLGLPRQEIRSAYTGSRFENGEIESLLNEKGIAFQRLEGPELNDFVTSKLIDGGIVGWFQGRAEFGPRALGGRSILADPRRTDIKDILNLKIKRRESFRPFAPSILEDFVGEYFEQDAAVPFMERVFKIKETQRSKIPAVTHVDGTGRLQTVSATHSPEYYSLIEAFRQKTGVPILVNTSFNENEPIVNTPAEALDCYLRTKMDMLVMQNYVVWREEN